jgi:glycosyltransferase involved in cell wall biosynthesis
MAKRRQQRDPDLKTDIVVTTRNRRDILERTLTHILERTRVPFALHVIDDASDDGTTAYLLDLMERGVLSNLLIRGNRAGQMANLNVATWLSFSDPVVLTDDDVLCPDVEPCWLARGLAEMKARLDLGILALNHPGAHRRREETSGEVTYCGYVGGTFMLVRRKLLNTAPLPHFRDNFGVTPTVKRCNLARRHGYRVGYLTDTYCYHIGLESQLTGRQYGGRFIEPLNWKTLEPPERWAR